MIITHDGILIRLGKDIIIDPYDEKSIKGIGCNLHVSEYAWSIVRKKRVEINAELVEGNTRKYYLFEPNETILIWTKETVWISSRIAGTFHSKVDRASEGFSSISTTLDPGWIGPLLIAITNLSKSKKPLYVDDTFVTLIFHKAEKVKEIISFNTSGRIDRLNRLGIQMDEDAEKWINEEFRKNVNALKRKVKEEKPYKNIVTKEMIIRNFIYKNVLWIPFILFSLFLFLYIKDDPKPNFYGHLITAWIASIAIGISGWGKNILN